MKTLLFSAVAIATISGCTTGELSLENFDAGGSPVSKSDTLSAGPDATTGVDGQTARECESADCQCLAPSQLCDGVCTDTASNSLHCGGCGQACPSTASCANSKCQCPQGQTLCGDRCVDTTSDPGHCGDCNVACDSSQVCSGSSCQSGCGELSACSRACVDLQSDPANCGSCGFACGDGRTCANGTCVCRGEAPAFAQVEQLMVSSCLGNGCHSDPTGPNGPAEGLSLESGAWYGAMVEVPASQCGDGRLLVGPGDPSASYLIQKLTGRDMCSGSLMPKAGRALPSQDIELIASWICHGASR